MNSVMGYIAKFIIIIGMMLLLLTFAIGCGQDKNQEVTFQELLTNPGEFEEKEITLVGFYFQGFEVQVIAERLEYSGYAVGHMVPKGEMIWLEGGLPAEVYDRLYQQKIMTAEERYGKVRVTGTFECRGKYGHLGGYNPQIVPSKVILLE